MCFLETYIQNVSILYLNITRSTCTPAVTQTHRTHTNTCVLMGKFTHTCGLPARDLHVPLGAAPVPTSADTRTCKHGYPYPQVWVLALVHVDLIAGTRGHGFVIMNHVSHLYM